MAYKIPPYQPNQIMYEFDDFLSQAFTAGWKLNWAAANIQQWQPQGVGPDAGHPGIATTIAGFQPAYLVMGDGNPTSLPILLGSGVYEINWVFKILTLSTANLYTLYVGLTHTTSNGVYFSYNDTVNSGNWTMNTANGGIFTSVDSGIAATTGWVNLGVKIIDNTSCFYYINGVQVGSPIITNIPVIEISPAWLMTSIGSPPEFLIDLFYMTFTATTPR